MIAVYNFDIIPSRGWKPQRERQLLIAVAATKQVSLTLNDRRSSVVETFVSALVEDDDNICVNYGYTVAINTIIIPCSTPVLDWGSTVALSSLGCTTSFL